jgi:hypothetical protein
LSRRPALQIAAYAAVALAIAFELAVVWLMLHPEVPADYRAYYIDRTTTCLNQPVSGDYAFGTNVSFRSEGRALAMPLRVCGWEGPAGDGTHAVGTSSRLRFTVPEGTAGPLVLRLELVAIARDGHPVQRVEIFANGAELGVPSVLPETPQAFELSVPASVLRPGPLEVELRFPDAVRMAPGDSDTRMRSIKLLSARLGPAPGR